MSPAQYLAFEHLISELSNAFAMTLAEDVDRQIDRWLQRVTEFLGLEGAAVFEFAADGRSGRIKHVWLMPGLSPLPEYLTNADWPWVFDEIAKGRTIAFESFEDLPVEAEADARTYQRLGVQSCLSVPLSCGGVAMGALAFGTIRHRRAWPKSIAQRIRLAGELFGTALARKRAQGELRGMIKEWQTTFDATPDAVMVLDTQLRVTRANAATAWFLNLPLEQIISRECHALVHGTDVPVSGCPIRQAAETKRHAELELRDSDREAWYLVSADPILGAYGEIAGFVHTIKDITQRKRAELELSEAYRQIESLKNQLQAENVYLREELSAATGHGEIVGTSETIGRVVAQARQVAPTDSSVLILGDTGTGKELLAHFIHQTSRRSGKPFVIANLAAMPATLIEGELFGREKGAYTGALTRQAGRFEVADGGTIFLDEIGEMPMDTQTKLLRVLQSGEFERLGSSRTTRASVRVIAATNRDLAAAIRSGAFRQDLYYRLNVFPITVPPLRERREDIPLLAQAFAREFGERMGKPVERIRRRSLDALQAYSWPGNVRELRNVIERSMILTEGPELRVVIPESTGPGGGLPLRLQDMDKQHILHVLEKTGWRIRGPGGAAEVLGLKPTTLHSRMRKLGIQRQV